MDLSLVPVNDLVEELINRHDHIVLIGAKVENNGEIKSMRRWRGNSYTCSGMAQCMSMQILDSLFQQEKSIGSEDL